MNALMAVGNARAGSSRRKQLAARRVSALVMLSALCAANSGISSRARPEACLPIIAGRRVWGVVRLRVFFRTAAAGEEVNHLHLSRLRPLPLEGQSGSAPGPGPGPVGWHGVCDAVLGPWLGLGEVGWDEAGSGVAGRSGVGRGDHVCLSRVDGIVVAWPARQGPSNPEETFLRLIRTSGSWKL